MEKILFSYDVARAESEIRKLEEIRDKTQIVLDLLIEMIPNVNFTLEEIKPFIFQQFNRFGVDSFADDITRQAKILIAKKTVGRTQMKGVPIVWETFIQNMELPDTGNLEKAMREVRVKIRVFNDLSPLVQIRVIDNPINAIQINKNKVEFIPGTVELVQEGYKKYIEDESQQERLEIAQKVAVALNEAIEAGTGGFIIANPGDLSYIVEFDESGLFKPAWSYVNSEW